MDHADKIYIPSFICQDVINVLSSKNIEVQFYEINKKLNIEENSINLSTINNRTIILIVNYFGFPSNWEYIENIKNTTKCIIVEDNCHTLNSTYRGKELGNYGDISFNSLRKVLPVLSGSIIRCNNDKYFIENNKTALPNFSQIKYSFRGLKKLSNNIPLQSSLPNCNFSAIDIFSKIIYSKYYFNYLNIKKIRIANFKFWNEYVTSKGLKSIINLQNLDNVIPYAFPCITNNYNETKKWIEWGYVNNITIIEWPNLSKNMTMGIDSLKNILLFPVNDQRILTIDAIPHEF